MKNYFDYEVLEAGSDDLNQKAEIKERIFVIVKKNSTKYQKQIHKAGKAGEKRNCLQIIRLYAKLWLIKIKR